MKRVGNIFDAVVERENLRDAFLMASRGKRVTTLAALQAVPGFGESRTEKYGKAFLDVLKEIANSDASEKENLKGTER